LIATTADKVEEVELARTLLAQGHLETAQKVLLKVCQEQPDLPQAFRTLAQVLERRGDGKRARILVEYAAELDGGSTSVLAEPANEDLLSEAETSETRLKAVTAAVSSAPPAPVTSAERLVGPPSMVAAQEAPLTLPSPMQSLAATPTPRTSSPALSSPQMPRAKRSGILALLAVLAVAAIGAAVAGYTLHGRDKRSRPSAREELDRALASGALESLMRAREVVRIGLDGSAPDADALVRLALVNALLASDYAVDFGKEAEDALKRADTMPMPNTERSALAATARALLALAGGDRAAAKEQADLALAADTASPPAFALLVSARVRGLAGDVEGAAKDLDRAIGAGPDLLPVAVGWAASRIEGGDPVVARRALLAMLGKSPDNSRAQLVLADAERALGESTWSKRLETACGGDSKISRSVRATCATQSALQSRLEGDRAGAIRKAKAIAQTTEDPTLLGQLASLLALLGEVDSADEVLQRVGKGADPSMVGLQWASVAIRLGRGDKVEASALLDHPAGPERDLIALRAAYARSGKEGLAAALRSVPPGILDIDWDIRAFAVLAHDTAPAKPELWALEKKGEKGNPVATYVLGIFALQEGDFKAAARRFEHSLSLHGDGCRSATLYLEAVSRLGRGAVLNKAGLRAVRARNAKCPLPET
jgi:tetratricopeptide (TPR) repeat protein